MQKKILIIDDDELFLAIMQTRLEVGGFEVQTCQTGEEGVRLFGELNPDLVLLDIKLPTMSSREVFDRIKTLNPLSKIVTTSAYTSPTTEEEEKKRGADSFYDKALQSEKLIRDIRVMLGIQ